tara:strand:+ start:905 stop:1600 length:696 start_codon:yes stop_codon:yes gene_type:complete
MGPTVKFVNNAPVILSLTIISTILFIVDQLLPKFSIIQYYFATWPFDLRYFTQNPTSKIPLFLFRLFSHTFGHSSISHLLNNYKFILLLGPNVEHMYGAQKLTLLLLLVSLISGTVHTVSAYSATLCGSSSVVFAFVALSTRQGLVMRDNKDFQVPATLVLVVSLFILQEMYDAASKSDNISQLSHLIGAFGGIIFAFQHIETKNTQKSFLQQVPFYFYTPNVLDNIKKQQ